MSKDTELEKIRKFDIDITNGLKQERQITVNALFTEDVVEYCEQSMKWTAHKWEVNLAPDNYKVERDGVEFENVVKVSTEYDYDDKLPKLTIECPFNGFDLNMNSDGTQQVIYKNVWLEEVESYQIINDPQNNFITHIRFTVIADADIHWDYAVERGERENPIEFPKINYHKNPLLSETAYTQALNEVKQLDE